MLSDPLLPSGPKLDMLSLQCCVAELACRWINASMQPQCRSRDSQQLINSPSDF